MTDFSFKKTERLKSAKVISQMFNRQGQSFGVYPLRLVWMRIEAEQPEFPVQFTQSVAKKSFKSAVARNRLRRKIREAWRLNKHRLYRKLEGLEGQLAFMVIYSGKEDLPFEQIEAAMKTMIHLFLKKSLPQLANQSKPMVPLS